MRRRYILVLLGLALGCGGSDPETTIEPEDLEAITSIPFRSGLFTGQTMPVLPITLVVPDSSLASGEFFKNRPVVLAWSDSIIQAKLEERAADVTWIFPPAIRRIAQRSPGVVADPDRLGQSVMQSPGIKVVPDPLRSNLRTLVAMTGGRLVLIPAAMVFKQPEPGTVEVQLMLVAADVRTGNVVWRSIAVGESGTPGLALGLALDSVLPVDVFAP